MRVHSFVVSTVASMLAGLTMTGTALCQAGAGGGGAAAAGGGANVGAGQAGVSGGAAGISGNIGGAGIGGAGMGGAGYGSGSFGQSTLGGATGAHQGNILTGPGASGVPQNYFRGAMPGMNQSPQEAPSGAFNSGLSTLRSGGRGGQGSLGPRRGRTGGNGAVGRGVGPAPRGGDENPAETLLDEMNGSRNGKRTGHAALRPPPRYQRGPGGLSSDPPSLAPRRIEERAVYFAQRGAYEDMVYRPYQGTYRQQRRPVAIARGRRVY
jgi:hypothetical protein